MKLPDKKDITVAIHQPNFFPWLGYFKKIEQSDIFIFLDSVQFPKKGGTYCNRFGLLIAGNTSWCTAPVIRSFHGTKNIAEMVFDPTRAWRKRITNAISSNYAKAHFFSDIFPFVEALLMDPDESLADYNIRAIRGIVEFIGLDAPRFVRSSRLAVQGNATRLLIALTKEVGGTRYLSGDGAGGYQENELFAGAGLALAKLNFRHPVYNQGLSGQFIPGLSVIDALMHCGPTRTRQMLVQ